MNSSGKQLVAFWLHRNGERWSVKAVDKEKSTLEVECIFQSKYTGYRTGDIIVISIFLLRHHHACLNQVSIII